MIDKNVFLDKSCDISNFNNPWSNFIKSVLNDYDISSVWQTGQPVTYPGLKGCLILGVTNRCDVQDV